MTASTAKAIGGHERGFAVTGRSDRWWVGPLATSSALTVVVVYMTWAAFAGEHYYADPYLSPLYSPVLFFNEWGSGVVGLEAHAWFGAWPDWWPPILPASPALLILAFPGAFRFTCYYYRKAYYRSFALSPPGCAVGPVAAGKKRYRGETFLLLFQNLHRYALYAALLFLPILLYDALSAFSREGELGVGVGTLVLLANVCLLTGYTMGCHSFRHLVGGRSDCMSCGRATIQFRVWRGASWFNLRHMNFAWVSLFWVCFTDLYVRLVSMGLLVDLNTWGN